MAILRESQLQSSSFQSAGSLNEVRTFSSYGIKPTKVFISYKHEDKNLVTRVAKLLKLMGVDIYIDYLDTSLSNASNTRAAGIIRQRVSNCNKIVQLLSLNSASSKWMPWELGLGDGLLGYNNAIILQVTDDTGRNISQEFINLYGTIDAVNSPNGQISSLDIVYPDGRILSFRDWLEN